MRLWAKPKDLGHHLSFHHHDGVVIMSLDTGVAQTGLLPTVHDISWATQHVVSPPSRTQISQLSNGNKNDTPPRGVAGGYSEFTYIAYPVQCLMPKQQQLLLSFGSPR